MTTPLLSALLSGCAFEFIDLNRDEDNDGIKEIDGDCDDHDFAIKPGQTEVPYDGIDQDCSGADLTDVDSDGHDDEAIGGSDCDDTNSEVNPDAEEVCNEIDDDCDSYVDEGVTIRSFQDADGDGFGNYSIWQDLCFVPEGYVENSTDCNDADPTIHPNAAEICNYLDDNCNGTVDEGVQTSYYQDADLDGFGNPLVTVDDCTTPPDYVENNSDCDDNESLANPSLTEICNDQIDNDCDGTDNGCGLSGTVGLASADAKLIGEVADDYAGRSVTGAGDVNGDGVDDLIVGAWGNDGGGDFAGSAYLVLGPISGTQSLSTAEAKLTGEAMLDYAGESVSGAGDVNGDGVDDLLVVAPYNDGGGSDAGAAYLILGPVNGTQSLSLADAKLTGEAAFDYAGSVSGAGDVNGDGVHDLLVGVPFNDAGGSDAGAAYLVLGPVTGTQSLSAADAKLTGEAATDYAGDPVSGGGDVNGDGIDDFIVGAPSNDAGGNDAGAAYVVLGPVTGTQSLSAADAKLTGEVAGDAAGFSVSGAADIDGDGVDDLLVGAPDNDAGGSYAGAAYLILGPVIGTQSLAAADAQLIGEAADDAAGFSVSVAGDVDGDGADDFLVGAHLNDAVGARAGVAYLILGPVLGMQSLSTANAKLTGEAAGDWAGWSVSGAGDVNGDGLDDFLVGASLNDEGGSNAGATYLLYGSGM